MFKINKIVKTMADGRVLNQEINPRKPIDPSKRVKVVKAQPPSVPSR